MLHSRPDGAEHPGWRWGPFTARIPVLHTRIEWPEFFQGLLLCGATGLALVPIYMKFFGLSFEGSIAITFVNSLLIASAPILFGEPYAPGWITPMLPLSLLFLEPRETPAEAFHAMTAIALDLAAILFFLGFTGLGKRFMDWIPRALKGGILMGAAIAAFKKVIIDDYDRNFNEQRVATILAIGISLVLIFSAPVQRWKAKNVWVRRICNLGLLPGFVVAAVVGGLVGEFSYHVEGWVLIPDFGELFRAGSPFSIGWPSLQLCLEGLPLALMGYVILFGDWITGTSVNADAAPSRPDETISQRSFRSHLSVGIRNVAMGLFAPFFPTQGAIWTGAHIIIVQRWKEGRKGMDSLFGGISSFYIFTPIFYCARPIVTGLQPLMGIALTLTLVLTGFAVSYVAMAIPKTPTERGVAVLTGAALAFLPAAWMGLVVGLVATLLLVGAPGRTQSPSDTP